MSAGPGRVIVKPIVTETVSAGGIIQPDAAEDDKFRLKRGIVIECGAWTTKSAEPCAAPDWPLPPGTFVQYNSVVPWSTTAPAVAIEGFAICRYFIPESPECPPESPWTPVAIAEFCVKHSAPLWYRGAK